MINIKLKKILKDITQNKSRSVLVVIAIFIGIFSFTMMLTTYSLLKGDIEENYVRTNPADAIISTNSISSEQITWLNSLAEIEIAEARRIINGRIEFKPGVWKKIELFVIDNFSEIAINTFFPENGKFIPAPGEIVIERNAMDLFGTVINKSYNFSIPGSESISLTISGEVHDPGQAPAWMEGFGYGYMQKETLSLFGMEANLNKLYLRLNGDLQNETSIRNTIEELRPLLNENGITINNLTIPPPGKHPHETQMSSLMYIQQVICIIILIFSSFLIINMISSLMSGQTRQIAAMKSAGGTTSQIAIIYLGIAMMLDFISSLFSIPLGILSGIQLAQMMATQLNFILFTKAVSIPVFLLICFISLGIPILISLIPVIKGNRISVKDGISDYGVGELSQSKLERKAVKVKGQLWQYAFRNSFRKKGRMILILIALTLGGTLFLSSRNITSSIIKTIQDSKQSKSLNIMMQTAKWSEKEKFTKILSDIKGIKYIEYVSVLKAFPLDSNNIPGNEVTMIALPSNPQTLNFEVIEGVGLTENNENTIIINHMFSRKYPNLKIDDNIDLLINNRVSSYSVIGIVQELPAGPTIYINANTNKSIIPSSSSANGLYIRTSGSDIDNTKKTAALIEIALAKAKISVLSLYIFDDIVRAFEDHMVMVSMFLLVVAILMVIVGTLGLSSAMSMNILERRKEIGIMKSCGASNTQILRIILIEGGFIGIISWLLSAILSIPTSYILGNGFANIMLNTSISFTVSAPSFLLWFVIIILFSLFSGYYPGRKAANKPVQQVLAYE